MTDYSNALRLLAGTISQILCVIVRGVRWYVNGGSAEERLGRLVGEGVVMLVWTLTR